MTSWQTIVLGSVFVLGLSVGCGKKKHLEPGADMPSLSLTTLAGETIALPELCDGQPAVVVFGSYS